MVSRTTKPVPHLLILHISYSSHQNPPQLATAIESNGQCCCHVVLVSMRKCSMQTSSYISCFVQIQGLGCGIAKLSVL